MRTTILIVAGKSIFGPFPDQGTAQGWLDNGHAKNVGAAYELYSIRDCEIGTIERADECGTRLPSIAEATTTQHTSRKAAGA